MTFVGEFIGTHRRLTASGAALVLVGAGVIYGPKIYHDVDNALFPESKIVAGVPAQVESHFTTQRCTDNIKGVCYTYGTLYHFELEQCKKDVTNAENGRQTSSFDPKLGEIYSGCYADSVQVSHNTWSTYPDGSTIVFAGATGIHLDK